MRETRVYVVRIYRQTGSRIAGLAENVRTGEAKAFGNAQELSAFLIASPHRLGGRRGLKAPDGGNDKPG
jgi:hypothetical protein